MERLLGFLRTLLGDVRIERLPKTFAAVATDIRSGREIWLERGSLLDAVRASAALPGLFTPVRYGKKWLVDGGLVNPVPVSMCRALGAEIVIAADLNTGIVGKHSATEGRGTETEFMVLSNALGGLAGQITASLRRGTNSLIGQLRRTHPEMPHLFEVLAGSLNIMQDRITRSRMAGDPPDILLMPRLRHLALLEFDRAEEAIEEGKQSVARMLPAIEALLD